MFTDAVLDFQLENGESEVLKPLVHQFQHWANATMLKQEILQLKPPEWAVFLNKSFLSMDHD